jgi:hypothetical protein
MPDKNKIIIRKATSCPKCNSFVYTFPANIDPDIAANLSVFGEPIYPLDKFKVLKIETEGISIDGLIGRQEIRVKFKQDAVSMSALFRTSVLSWIEGKIGPSEFVGGNR